MSDDLYINVPGPIICPDCGEAIDMEDEDCRIVVIVICPCGVAFQYEDEPKYH